MIHLVDGLSDKVLDVIDIGEFWDDVHFQSLRDNTETFDFLTFGDRPFSNYLGERNRLIIPGEDGVYVEFIISYARKYRDGLGVQVAEVRSNASYLDIAKAKVISPGTLESATVATAVSLAIGGTEWQAGRLESEAVRTIYVEKHTNPYALLKHLATEFNLELQFRTEVGSNRIVGRYVDLIQRVGNWQGREVEFGSDLVGIERIENTDDIVTSLVGIGPEREDGTRLEVTVSDNDAWQRWGRVDHATGIRSHIVETYEPQSEDQDMTIDRLTTLTENELEKRVNAIVEYVATAADLENVPGLENKEVRLGDSIRVKDSAFVPPIYLDARVHTQERSIVDKSRKSFVLGDFIEYTEEDINALWASMQLEIQRRLARLISITVLSDTGDVFKNGAGTANLSALVFLSGAEVDENGSVYTYSWTKNDKDGVRDMSFAKSGKSITVTSSDVNVKATFFVDISVSGEVIQTGQFTISDLFDGEDGADGQSLYTWIKYADDSNGSGLSDSPTGKEYIGMAYNKNTPTESSNAADYSWAKIQGDQGVRGPAGADGQPTYTWIKYADDAQGNGFSDSSVGKSYIGLAHNKTTAVESNSPGDYTWSKFVGPQGPQGIEGPPGKDGQPTYTWVKYADTSTGSGMNDSPTGKKYIGLAYNKTTPTESSTASDYTWSLIQGPQGIQGPSGDDGQSLYTWLKYADSPTTGMSDSPTGKKYMGIAYNKSTPTESTTYADYTWSLVQGPQGPTGPQGPNIVDSTTQIEANVIKSNHIDVGQLSAIVADLGTITAGHIEGVTGSFKGDLTSNDVTIGPDVLSEYQIDEASILTMRNPVRISAGSFAWGEPFQIKVGNNYATVVFPFPIHFDTDVVTNTLFVRDGMTFGHAEAVEMNTYGNIIAKSSVPSNGYWAVIDKNGRTILRANIGGTGEPIQLAQTGFYGASLSNGWSNYSSDYPVASYMKDSSGIVHLRGLIAGGSLNATAFTLPAGYRPYRTMSFPCIDSSNAPSARVNVYSSGAVQVRSGNNAHVSLDAIKFWAER